MSDFSKETERIIDLVQHLPELEEMAKVGTRLGTLALTRAIEEIDELSQNEAVLNELTSVLSAAQSEISQIEADSGSLIELGLVTEDEVEAMKQEILGMPEMRAAELFVKDVGTTAVKGAVEPVLEEELDVPESEETETTAEEENDVTAVRIKFLGKGIQIGERGKFVQLSNRAHDGQRDYSYERKQLLKALVERQGEETSARELFEAALPDLEFDRDLMRQFKRWAAQLTFRKQSIVEHNGKRGPASAYSISSKFDISLHDITISQRPIAARTTAIPMSPTIEGTAVSETTSDDTPRDSSVTTASIKKTSTTPESRSEVHFPLNQVETHVIAEVIDLYSLYFKEHGLPVIPRKVVADLAKSNTSPTDLARLLRGRDILEVRAEIADQIIEYFKHPDYVLRDIDSMSERDNRREFFEYLLAFDDTTGERTKILTAIAAGDTAFEIKYGGRRGTDIVGAGFLTDSDVPKHYVPKIIDEIEEDDVTAQAVSDKIVADEAGESKSVAAEESDSADAPVVVEVIAVEEDLIVPETDIVDAPKEVAKEKKVSSKQARLTEIGQVLAETLDVIIKQNLTNRKVEGIRSVLPFVTARNARNASENGHISRDTKVFTYKDILTLTAMHHFAKEFSLPKGGSINRRHIEKIIDDLLAKADLA